MTYEVYSPTFLYTDDGDESVSEGYWRIQYFNSARQVTARHLGRRQRFVLVGVLTRAFIIEAKSCSSRRRSDSERWRELCLNGTSAHVGLILQGMGPLAVIQVGTFSVGPVDRSMPLP